MIIIYSNNDKLMHGSCQDEGFSDMIYTKIYKIR